MSKLTISGRPRRIAGHEDPAKRHKAVAPLTVKLAFAWLAGVALIGVGAELLSPYDYTAIDLRARLAPPALFGGSWAHPLGTDHLGRDLLSRLIHATRFSLLIALVGTLIGAVLGTMLGFLAAHFRGVVDDLIMMLVDFQAAVPFVILALAAIAFLGNNLVLFVCILGLQGWERYARIARGLALAAKERGYVVALRTAGARPWRIYAKHILPNVAGALIVQVTLNFPETILWESALSFLGLGIQPPNTSLGALLGFGRDYLFNAWWLALFPGCLIVVTTLAMSLCGDWLRDRLDPRLRRA